MDHKSSLRRAICFIAEVRFLIKMNR